jgi:DNA-binding NtrC family response regulator
VKLLRFLQERAYEPLGATFTTRADVRILSATNHDLERMVEAGTFRRDLFYRINVMQIQLPPLAERAEDIPLLVRHFIKRFRHTTGKAIETMTESALAALMRHPFPGNVRELENIVERAFIICQGPIIGLEHLPVEVAQQLTQAAPHLAGRAPELALAARTPLPYGFAADPHQDILNLVERDTIVATLKRNRGNRSRAARELGIHRSTLLRKLKRYGLP